MNFNKKPGIKNIIMANVLKFILKRIKKDSVLPKPFIVLPKNPVGNKWELIHKCSICKHRFLLKSDKPISQKTTIEWINDIRKHKCYADKKNTNN